MLPNYKQDEFGVIHQIDRKPYVYDTSYIDKGYGTLRQLTDEMAYLRLGYIRGAIGIPINSILDVGYGTGDFLKVCKRTIPNSCGHDLFKDLLPEGCTFIDSITDTYFDVITFFDSLEHYPDIDFVRNLQCRYVVISLPWCHNINDEWFENWKHRKPDEHLHHFNRASLQAFMNDKGFDMVTYNNVEDTIRTSTSKYPNILTAVFKKRD